MLLHVARKSLLNRKVTVVLTIFAITVSVFVLLGVEHIRHEAKTSFTRTISDTDLVAGGRTGKINLLLYSIFRIGNATNNITWKSYERLASVRGVKWTIPFSLGDSHKGYRVLGTTDAYFKHYRYGNKQPLAMAQGSQFKDLFDVVIGSDVAKKLNYRIGQKIVLAHGVSTHSFSVHDDKPFTVVGILKPTGTPVDQTLHVSLAAIEAIHLGWSNGVRLAKKAASVSDVSAHDLNPREITAFLVGFESKVMTFSYQRLVNDYPKEALMAILPGAIISELWQMIGSVEVILLIISALVLLSALIGMSTMLLSSLRERNRELAILRAIGAGALFNLLLIEIEVLLITLAGILIAIASLFVFLYFGQELLMAEYGLFISIYFITPRILAIVSVILFSSLLLGLIPGFIAYRRSLQQGLTIRQ
ncbi:MAG: ABC transporter permease [Gammaproteobacteria bacterium]|nr:ABC transporter permease [Gammaproteobacteria bacterium]